MIWAIPRTVVHEVGALSFNAKSVVADPEPKDLNSEDRILDPAPIEGGKEEIGDSSAYSFDEPPIIKKS